MATRHHKSSKRLHKRKAVPQRQFTRFKRTLTTRLTQLDDDLHSLLQNHAFLEHAVINLAADELEPELWLAGAVTHQRWLKQSGENIAEQLRQVRHWVNQ
jgi:hypothetical protein